MTFLYVTIPPLRHLRRPALLKFWGKGRFKNSPEVIPGRWGWYWYGFEFGSRNPGDKVGVWLKRRGLWPY